MPNICRIVKFNFFYLQNEIKSRVSNGHLLLINFIQMNMVKEVGLNA
jgi:hypothetical protein